MSDDTAVPVEDQPRARFKNEGEAFEHLQAEKAGEPEPDFATRDVDEATRDTFRTADDAHEHLRAETQEHRDAQQREADETEARERAHEAGLANLAAKGKAHAEALEQHIPALQRTAQEFRQQLAAAQQLTDPGQRQIALAALEERGKAYDSWVTEAGVSKLAAEQGRMVELRPQLGTKEGRQKLAQWAEAKGYSKAQIQNASLQQVVAAFDAMQAEQGAVRSHQERTAAAEREAKLNRPRKSLHTGSYFGPAGPAPAETTVDEARTRLAKTGSMRDALNILTLGAEKQKEASRGR